MLEKAVQINRILRAMVSKSHDALHAYYVDNQESMQTINGYLQKDFRQLKLDWPTGLYSQHLANLERHLRFGQQNDYDDIIQSDIPGLEYELDSYFLEQSKLTKANAFETLLHPAILRSSYTQFQNRHYRDAVFNAILAVFELIKNRTGLDKDGAELVGEALSLQNPILIFSTLKTESGRDEQKGFIQILQGAYLGIRNPKAHSLLSDLDEQKTLQYLIFASLLARRIEDAKKVSSRKPKQART